MLPRCLWQLLPKRLQKVVSISQGVAWEGEDDDEDMDEGQPQQPQHIASGQHPSAQGIAVTGGGRLPEAQQSNQRHQQFGVTGSGARAGSEGPECEGSGGRRRRSAAIAAVASFAQTADANPAAEEAEEELDFFDHSHEQTPIPSTSAPHGAVSHRPSTAASTPHHHLLSPEVDGTAGAAAGISQPPRPPSACLGLTSPPAAASPGGGRVDINQLEPDVQRMIADRGIMGSADSPTPAGSGAIIAAPGGTAGGGGLAEPSTTVDNSKPAIKIKKSLVEEVQAVLALQKMQVGRKILSAGHDNNTSYYAGQNAP